MLYLLLFILFTNNTPIYYSYGNLLILPSIYKSYISLHNLHFILHLMLTYKFYVILVSFYFVYH